MVKSISKCLRVVVKFSEVAFVFIISYYMSAQQRSSGECKIHIFLDTMHVCETTKIVESLAKDSGIWWQNWSTSVQYFSVYLKCISTTMYSGVRSVFHLVKHLTRLRTDHIYVFDENLHALNLEIKHVIKEDGLTLFSSVNMTETGLKVEYIMKAVGETEFLYMTELHGAW